MSMTRLFVMSTLLGSTLVACGDDGGGTTLIDAAKTPDAPGIDAPAMVACPPATLGMGSIGTAAAPASGNFVRKTTTGTMNPFLGISSYTTMDMKNAITFVWPKPTAGFAAGTFPWDNDPNAMNPAALSFFEGGLDPANPMADAAHFLWTASGTLTIQSVTKTGAAGAGENPNDVFTGSVSATMYRELDAQGAVLPGGCTVMAAGITFVTKDPNGSAIPAPQDVPAGWREAREAKAMAVWNAIHGE